jgi:ABC-type Fe3+ transport system permease subunit
MLIIGSALSNIDTQLEESGLVFTKLHRVIYKITLPLIKPALISSFVLVFIFSISEFSVPAFFGVKVFTTEIFTQFSAFYNHSLAILQSGLLILICVLLLFSERKHIADAPFLSVSGKGTKSKAYDLKNWGILSVLFLFGWFLFTVALPFIILFIQSFKKGTSSFIQAFELLLPTFGSSIGLAFSGALIIVFVGFTAAYFSARRGGKTFDWLLLIIFAIPSIIFGISLIKFYNHPMLDYIYSGYAIILIGYVGKFSFISAKLISNAIKQIPNSLDEAAQIEGVSFTVRLRKILIPLIMPTLFVAFIISFIFCLGELGTTIMLYPPGTEIMPIKVYTIMANAPQSLTSSMTLIVFSITLLIITGFYFIVKPTFKKYSPSND